MEIKDNSPKITKYKNSITIDGISVPENAEANIAKEDGKWVAPNVKDLYNQIWTIS